MIKVGISLFLLIIFMLVLPFCLGTVFISFTRIEKNPINSYVSGFLTMMAICELIAVPCTIFKASFSVARGIFVSIVVIILIIGVVNKCLLVKIDTKIIKDKYLSYGTVEYITLVAALIVWSVIIVNSLRLYVLDQDDSRFVVTASDMLRTDTLFLSDPNTGIVHDTWVYGIDASKDIIAPHAVFCAILSWATSTDTTLFMHSIYPVFLYILAFFIYNNLISELIEGNDSLRLSKHRIAYKNLFLILIAIITIFHYSTRNTRETVFLVRLWQGKAILASIILPALFWVLYLIYRKADKGNYVLLFTVSLAGCLTSSMATLLLPLVIGVYGLVYGIVKKSVRVSVCIWLSAVIPVILALLSLYIRNEIIIC